MANINAILPSAIATPFHPPTEALHHDNLIKPIIPKSEVIIPYSKFREDQDEEQFSRQSRSVIQIDNNEQQEQYQEAKSSVLNRRVNFFGRRSELSQHEIEEKKLEAVTDLKKSKLVIEARYHDAVNPFPEPSINYTI